MSDYTVHPRVGECDGRGSAKCFTCKRKLLKGDQIRFCYPPRAPVCMGCAEDWDNENPEEAAQQKERMKNNESSGGTRRSSSRSTSANSVGGAEVLATLQEILKELKTQTNNRLDHYSQVEARLEDHSNYLVKIINALRGKQTDFSPPKGEVADAELGALAAALPPKPKTNSNSSLTAEEIEEGYEIPF